jgi:hypothetical protein
MSDIVTFVKAMIIGVVSELLAFFAPIGDNFIALEYNSNLGVGVILRNFAFRTASELKQALQGVMLCYELAEPE